MATLTIADLDNGKRDLQTVAEVATSRAATATTRFGQQTPTLYESIRRINATGDEILSNLGFRVPVPYASGLNVTDSRFTVTGPDGKVYAPLSAPFTTGAWDSTQWYVLQNDLNDHKLLVFDTLASASAAAATLPDGQFLVVSSDETRDGRRATYAIQGGTLAFDGFADVAQIISGSLSASKEWGVVPKITSRNASSDAVLNAQAQALLNRTEELKSASGGASALYGIPSDGATDATAAFELVADSGLMMAAGTTLLNAARISRGNVHGRGMNTVLKAMAAATSVLRLGWTSANGSWAPRKLSEMMIDGNAKASDGVTMWAATSPEISGRWTLDNIALANCNRAIYKPSGNIGNRFRDFSISGCNYGYYAVGQSAPLMHTGCDVLSSGEINSCDRAAVYIDSPQIGTGGTALRDMILEYNTGFGVFVKNWADSYTPLIFDNVWFEGNATASSVNINGTNYPPKDMRLENTATAIITNGMMPHKLELVNSRLHVENSAINDGTNHRYSIDANSVITAERISIDGGVHPIVVGSLVRARRPSGVSAQVHYANKRILQNGVLSGKLQSIAFDGAGPFSFTGSVGVDGTSVPDGRVFGSCCEIVIPSGATLVQPNVVISEGKWYVVTVDAKIVSGSTSGLFFGATYDVALVSAFSELLRPEWRTIASVSKCPTGGGGNVRLYLRNETGGNVTLRLSAWQIMQFDTEQGAIDYYNEGAYFK